MTPTRLALATLLIAAAPAAFANTAQVNVTGTITPASCNISIANGGNFDFGEISAADLNRDKNTLISAQTSAFSIDCDAPARFMVSATDVNEGENSNPGDQQFWLGSTAAGEAMGYFRIGLYTQASDIFWTKSADGGLTWNSSSKDHYLNYLKRHTETVGWTTIEGSNAGPEYIQQLTGELLVPLSINKASELTLNEDQKLDGGAVLTIVFL